MSDLPTIHARVHDSALKRVTRTFAATLAEIFTEVLQNARRAGASRVHVTLTEASDGPLTVTVSDDGAGIADPAVLLSFGGNGWDDDLVRREDAAGMGFLSLARRSCAVSSRPRARDGSPAPGWRVELAPEHFLGEAGAVVRTDDDAPFPHGTTVSFPTEDYENADAVRRALEVAARHYPLTVVFAHPPHTPPDGEVLERRDFLQGAVRIEHWRGLAFGVFRHCRQRFGLDGSDVNFHGVTVSAWLPAIVTVSGDRWSVAADIDDCPGLELVLPARKEAVKTPFLGEMRDAARLAIYRALAADPDPRPSFGDWQRAAKHGIDIAPPPPALLPWRPNVADLDHLREPQSPKPVGEDALIVAWDPEPPEAQAFWRAARRDGIAARLVEPNRDLEGYPWYDALPRVTEIRTDIITGGKTQTLDAEEVVRRRRGLKPPPPERPDAIRMVLSVRSAAGAEERIDLPADVAFGGEPWCWIGDALPLVTPDSAIEPHELAELLYQAFFSPADEAEADSWERQRADFEREALHIATRLLVSDDEARRRSIADTVERELSWLIPRGRAVDIAVRDRKVTVTLGDPETVAEQ